MDCFRFCLLFVQKECFFFTASPLNSVSTAIHVVLLKQNIIFELLFLGLCIKSLHNDKGRRKEFNCIHRVNYSNKVKVLLVVMKGHP